MTIVLFIETKYFKKENNGHYSISVPVWTGIEIGIPNYSFEGIGSCLNYKIWELLFQINTSYYFNTTSLFQLPDWQFAGGIYLADFFFNNNLNLKTGFKFNYTGKINYLSYYNVDPSNKLDFNLIGEIKERAIVYFVWENLFNNQYYITPYYPMPERNIRFGIAWELFN